jgi:hypothetical protein
LSSAALPWRVVFFFLFSFRGTWHWRYYHASTVPPFIYFWVHCIEDMDNSYMPQQCPRPFIFGFIALKIWTILICLNSAPVRLFLGSLHWRYGQFFYMDNSYKGQTLLF